MRLPISVCVIAKDEEQNIKESIESVVHEMEEVLVLDTGSKDQTINIAKQAGGVIKEFNWNDDFSAARNEIIKYASQPYILMMDADEKLIDYDYHRIYSDLQKIHFDAPIAGKVEIHNETEKGLIKTQITRLFVNDPAYFYKGKIHEQLTYQGNLPNTFSTSIKIYHRGYNDFNIINKNKTERNLKLLTLEWEKSPEDPYLLFQIGKTFSVRNDWKLAAKALEEALIKCDLDTSYRSSIIRSLAKVYLKSKQWHQLFNLLDKSLTTYPDYTDLYYIYGSAVIEKQDIQLFHNIPSVFMKCVEIGDADPAIYETEAGIGTYLAHYNLGLYYEMTLNISQAKYHYQKSCDYGFKPAHHRLAQLS